jgi:hypothetical protein
MSMIDHLVQSNQRAGELIMQFAGLYPARTAGLLARKLDELQAAVRGRLGLAGVIPVVLLRIGLAISLFAFLLAGVFWATLGSALVLAAGPSAVFGFPGNTTTYLPLGVLMGVANALLTIAALGYVVHLFVPPAAPRDPFGRAHFTTDRGAAERSGLRGAGNWRWP